MNLTHTMTAQRIEGLPTRTDAHPYGIDYPDRGCESGGPSCLACPLPMCIHDAPLMKRTMRVDAKWEVIRERRAGGESAREIAASMGIGVRTVHRAMRGTHETGTPGR